MVQYGQIIADHSIVDKFDDIPQYYIDLVKKMFVVVPGESHAQGYRSGLLKLETSYPTYAVNVVESGTPEAYTTSNLRFSGASWGDWDTPTGWLYNYGEEDWFTSTAAITQTKAGITYFNTHSLELAAIGFGWCWDMLYGGPTTAYDPAFGCRWWGSSVNGPEGNIPWGLDATDYAVTGNSVSMDTYLNATQQYINYCAAQGYDTKVFFTTGPVESYWNAEYGYQGHLKHEHIRNYVNADPTRILFDYADILCYDNNGTPTTKTWNGHTYPSIASTNWLPIVSAYHISEAGTVRLAKAMWWMLARIAGWDGITTSIDNQEGEDTLPGLFELTSGEIRINLDDNVLPATIRLFNMQGGLITLQETKSSPCILTISNLNSCIFFILLSSPKITRTYKVLYH